MPNPDTIFNISQAIWSVVSWRGIYVFIKFFFIFIDIILFIGVILVLHRTAAFKPPFGYPKKKGKTEVKPVKEETSEKWLQIINKSESSPPHSLTLAVIEADSLVAAALQTLGLSGDTMADRLSHLDSNEIRSLDSVWEAHKTRNEIVHTPGTEVDETTARRYLENYEKFLREIGAL